MDPRILTPEPYNILIERSIFTFEKYIGFYIWNLYGLIFPESGKKVDPYFCEKEPSEASGNIVPLLLNEGSF